jgi:hypothetical protein
MACPLTLSGIALDCKDIGGVKTVYIVDRNKVTNIGIDPITEVISGITLSGTTKFSTYNMNPQTGNLSSTITNSSENNTSFIESTLNLVFAKMTATKRIELNSLRIGELAVIVRDNNDNYWYLGYDNPVELLDGTVQTGTAFGDLNGYNINLIDRGFKLPYNISSTIISGIIS